MCERLLARTFFAFFDHNRKLALCVTTHGLDLRDDDRIAWVLERAGLFQERELGIFEPVSLGVAWLSRYKRIARGAWARGFRPGGSRGREGAEDIISMRRAVFE